MISKLPAVLAWLCLGALGVLAGYLLPSLPEALPVTDADRLYELLQDPEVQQALDLAIKAVAGLVSASWLIRAGRWLAVTAVAGGACYAWRKLRPARSGLYSELVRALADPQARYDHQTGILVAGPLSAILHHDTLGHADLAEVEVCGQKIDHQAVLGAEAAAFERQAVRAAGRLRAEQQQKDALEKERKRQNDLKILAEVIRLSQGQPPAADLVACQANTASLTVSEVREALHTGRGTPTAVNGGHWPKKFAGPVH